MSEDQLNDTSDVSEGQTQNEGPSLDVLPQLLPLALVITLTNSMVFCLFYTKSSLRKAANYPLLSLGICDFINGSLNIPLFIMAYIPIVSGPDLLNLYFLVEVSHNFIVITAACHILLITAEKYIAVMRPLKYQVIKKKTMLFIIAGIWLSSAVVSLVPISWFSKRIHRVPIGMYLDTIFCAFSIVAVFLCPYSFITYAHVVMFKEVFNRNRQRHALTHHNCSKAGCRKSGEKKCLIIFATMAMAFAVCWLPWFVLRLVYSLARQRLISLDHVVMETVAQIVHIVRYLTSAIDPLLYTFFKQDFWSALKNPVLRRSAKEYGHYSSSGSGKVTRRTTGKMERGGNPTDSLVDALSRGHKRYGSRRSFRMV